MMKFKWEEGATPIDPNEAAGLLPTWVSMQSELNAVEQDNIMKALAWLSSRKRRDVLSEQFLLELHERMFNEVWRWAGKFRRSNKNIGVDWLQIPIALRQMIDDVAFWCGHQSYSWVEIGARYHHRLVAIHCFANGNGRHARLAADELMTANGQNPFSWGAAGGTISLTAPTDARRRYIRALKLADQTDYSELIAFARS